MADDKFIELAGERVTLRRFKLSDLEPFVAYRSDPEVARYQTWDAPYPTAHGERLIAAMRRQHPDTPGQWFQFAVTLTSTGELIGDCGVKPDAADPRQVEIGYTIARPHHGHGYGTDTVRTLLGYLFEARSKHRVTASCDPRNTGSIRLLERIGLRREAHLRESSWFKGEWADDVMFAMLDREWHGAPRAEGRGAAWTDERVLRGGKAAPGGARRRVGKETESATRAEVTGEPLVDLLGGEAEVGE